MKQPEYPFFLRRMSADEGGGYLIAYPDLPGCMSNRETIEEAVANGRDAQTAWIAAVQEADRLVSQPSVAQVPGYSAKWQMHTPRSLHRSLADRARREGVCLNTQEVALSADGAGTS